MTSISLLVAGAVSDKPLCGLFMRLALSYKVYRPFVACHKRPASALFTHASTPIAVRTFLLENC